MDDDGHSVFDYVAPPAPRGRKRTPLMAMQVLLSVFFLSKLFLFALSYLCLR